MPEATDRVGSVETDGRLAFPAVPLSTALQLNSQIMRECKRDYIDGIIDDTKIAQILKHKPTSGFFKGKMYALNKYGLCTREGKLNRVTELGERLAEHELPQDVFAAFASYTPFYELYQYLAKNRVLEISFLEEKVAHYYHINEEKSKEFSRVFVKSLAITGRMKQVGNAGIYLNEGDALGDAPGILRNPDTIGSAGSTTEQDQGVVLKKPWIESFKVPAGEIQLTIAMGASYADVGATLSSLRKLEDKLNKRNFGKYVQ